MFKIKFCDFMKNNLSKIKVISFDADGTLWDFLKVMTHSLNHVLLELEKLDPIAKSKLSVEKMISIRNNVVEDLTGKVTNLEKIRYEAFRETLKIVGRPSYKLAKHLNEVYLKHRFEDIELFDDVLPTLNALKGKYSLIILSNGNSYPKKCGLDNIFTQVIFSQDYGISKPDPRIFEIAMEKAGCYNEQIIHIGDNLVTDVMGAQRVGITSVWLNRENYPNQTPIVPDYEVDNLTQLLEILS